MPENVIIKKIRTIMGTSEGDITDSQLLDIGAQSENIDYTKENLNNVENVKEALDDLYSKIGQGGGEGSSLTPQQIANINDIGKIKNCLTISNEEKNKLFSKPCLKRLSNNQIQCIGLGGFSNGTICQIKISSTDNQTINSYNQTITVDGADFSGNVNIRLTITNDQNSSLEYGFSSNNGEVLINDLPISSIQLPLNDYYILPSFIYVKNTSQNRFNLLNNVGQSNIVKSFLDIVYPIGSIYLATTPTPPEILFGGTWQIIPGGKFLLSQNNTDKGEYNDNEFLSGEIGGRSDWTTIQHTHSLGNGTIKGSGSCTPKGSVTGAGGHNHQVKGYGATLGKGSTGWRYGSGGGKKDGAVIVNGEGTHSHGFSGSSSPVSITIDKNQTTLANDGIDPTQLRNTNRPPYLVVYMWKRIA